MESKTRVKVTLQIPRQALAVLDEVAKEQLGIGRNSFFMIATTLLLVNMVVMTPAKKRLDVLKKLEEEVLRVFEKARKDA